MYPQYSPTIIGACSLCEGACSPSSAFPVWRCVQLARGISRAATLRLSLMDTDAVSLFLWCIYPTPGGLGNCLLKMRENMNTIETSIRVSSLVERKGPRSLCLTHDQEGHRAGRYRAFTKRRKRFCTRLEGEALWGWQLEMSISEQAAN